MMGFLSFRWREREREEVKRALIVRLFGERLMGGREEESTRSDNCVKRLICLAARVWVSVYRRMWRAGWSAQDV